MPLPPFKPTNKPPTKQPSPQRATDRPLRRGHLIAVLGAPGIGKTHLVSWFPKPYFAISRRETGILDLVDHGIIKHINEDRIHPMFESADDLTRFNDEVINRKCVLLPDDTQSIIYESVSGFEQLFMDKVCQTEFGGNWGNTAGGYQFYQKGDRIVGDQYWSKFLDQLTEIREMGYNVILTGHTTTKAVKNARGVDYLKEVCRCTTSVWEQTDYLVQNIFFLAFDVKAERESKFARGKAVSADRYLFCLTTPYNGAKNRYNIDDLIDANESSEATYKNFCAAAKLDPLTLRKKG